MELKRVYRITTYVPPEHLEKLLEGIFKVIPSLYGNYDQVAWWSAPGIEQFRPLSGSKPTLGQENVVQRNNSIKLEFSIPHDELLLQRVLTYGIKANHPWEEPVIYVDESIAVQSKIDKEDLSFV